MQFIKHLNQICFTCTNKQKFVIRIFSLFPRYTIQTHRSWDFYCFMHCFSYGFTEDFYDNRTAVPRRWIATKPPFVITPIVS